MIRESVKSSNIAKLGYDPADGTLEVEFNSKDRDGMRPVWAYNGVNPDVIERMRAPGASIGRELGIVKSICFGRKVASIDPDGVETRVDADA